MNDWLADRAADRVVAGLERSLHPRSADDGWIDIASNDYLGLARDPRVIDAGIAALRMWGAGSTASRLVRGDLALHHECEQVIADLMGAQSALVMSSGYLANLAAITALSDGDTLLVSDAHNHASLIDACRLSRGTVAVFPHADVGAATALLAERTQNRALLITDAVFSVDGDAAPLAELHYAACQYGATLVVDEAHSLGVMGHGRGLGPFTPDVVRTFTMSKSLGGQGGGVAASRAVLDQILNTARSFIFDTGLAPACLGSGIAAAQRIQRDPGMADRCRHNAHRLAHCATEAGWQPTEPDAGVVSIPVRSTAAAVAARDVLARHKVAVGCFRPPSVPDGRSRLRMTARSTLTEADFTGVQAALTAAREELA